MAYHSNPLIHSLINVHSLPPLFPLCPLSLSSPYIPSSSLRTDLALLIQYAHLLDVKTSKNAHLRIVQMTHSKVRKRKEGKKEGRKEGTRKEEGRELATMLTSRFVI